MNRIQFTEAISRLLQRMIQEGEAPIGDYLKRSTSEQQYMFQAGLSKDDGINKISQHQRGMALDIYFEDNTGQLCSPRQGWEYWHHVWTSMGGSLEIMWDKGHFQMV